MNEHESHEAETQTGAEASGAEPRPGPRIYVASLSDYNAGVLHGQWIEANDDPEFMQESIDTMLQASPTARREGAPAEEWAIHDFEGFGAWELSEWERLDTVAQVTRGIEQHGLAFAAWLTYVGIASEASVEAFEEAFLGEWASVERFAEDVLDEHGIDRLVDSVVPEWCRAYVHVDVAGFARDLVLGGEVVAVDRSEGGVWLFRA